LDEFRLLYPTLKKNVDVYILSSTKNKLDRLRATCYPFVKGFFNKPVKREQMEMLYLSYRNTDRMAG
jgi:hypothetical protein